MNISILGDGAWGTAIATLLANNNFQPLLWCYDQEVYQAIKETRFNYKYLKDIKLDQNIKVTDNLEYAITNSDIIFEAIPTKYLRSIVQESNKYTSNQPWIVLSKGIENNSLLFASEIVKDIIKDVNQAIISGPSFAYELASKQFTSVNLATQDKNLALTLKKILNNKYFKVNLTDDMIGIQVCGAFKNIIAIILGILDGAKYSNNTKAFFITKGLEEMAILTNSLGGKVESVYGLSGIGDLVLTATSTESKNFSLGQQIGLSHILNQDINNLINKHSTVEGLNTIISIYNLAKIKKIDLNLVDNLYQIITNKVDIKELFKNII